MYNARDIALEFIKKGIESAQPITQMQVQKMVYFAHGLYLADTNGKPLIKEKFQAWKYGPVIPSLYDTFKLYGKELITDTFWLKLSGLKLETISFDKKATEVVDATWDVMKDISPIKVSNWTHKEGSPWHKVYEEGVPNIFIPNDLIQEYFKPFIIEENEDSQDQGKK